MNQTAMHKTHSPISRSIAVGIFVVVLHGLFALSASAQTTLYFSRATSPARTGWSNTATVWATTTGGLYTQSWSDGANAVFETAVNPGSVSITGTITSVNSITFSGTGYTLSQGAINLTGDARLESTVDSASIGSVLRGSAGLTKTGTGTVVLTAGNTFSGNVAVQDGRLVIGTGNDRLPTGAAVTLGNGGTSAQFSLGSTSSSREQTITGLVTNGSGTANRVTGAGNATTFSKLTLNIASGTNTYGGFLGGPGTSENRLDLVKQGAGRLVLSASNSYAGSTQVAAGILEIASTGRINSTTGITLNGATAEFKYNSSTALTQPLTLTQGTLSGTGTIGTAVTFNTGDTLSPGNSPGTQSYTSLHAWAPGGTYRWEFNAVAGSPGTNWDVVNVTSGTFDLSALSATPGNQFALDLVTLDALNAAGALATPYDGGSSTLPIASYNPANFLLPSGFSNSAGADLTSLFAINLGSWQGAKPQLGDISVKINSSANGIDLVVVPEPGAFALAGLGIVLAGWLSRRRK